MVQQLIVFCMTGVHDGGAGITALHLPRSLEAIGDVCFEHCISIKSLRLPDSLRVVGHGSFGRCSGTPSLNLYAAAFWSSDFGFSIIKIPHADPMLALR